MSASDNHLAAHYVSGVNHVFQSQALRSRRFGPYLHDSVYVELRTDIRAALGPRAPVRRRKKRLAKKLAKRGGMLRCDGLMQRYYRAWPAQLEYRARMGYAGRWVQLDSQYSPAWGAQ